MIGQTNADTTFPLMGTCSTASTTPAKTVTIEGFVLKPGVRFYVKFTNADTLLTDAIRTLNVNGTGAKEIRVGGFRVHRGWIGSNDSAEFLYDGEIYQALNVDTVVRYSTDHAGIHMNRDGLLVQWGRIQHIGQNGERTVPYIQSYTHAPHVTVSSFSTNSEKADYGDISMFAREPSADSFIIYSTDKVPVKYWKAIGYRFGHLMGGLW